MIYIFKKSSDKISEKEEWFQADSPQKYQPKITSSKSNTENWEMIRLLKIERRRLNPIMIRECSSGAKLKTGKVSSQEISDKIKMEIKPEISRKILAQNVRKVRLLKMRSNRQLLYYSRFSRHVIKQAYTFSWRQWTYFNYLSIFVVWERGLPFAGCLIKHRFEICEVGSTNWHVP